MQEADIKLKEIVISVYLKKLRKNAVFYFTACIKYEKQYLVDASKLEVLRYRRSEN